MEFMERLGLLAMSAVGVFFFVFLFWRAITLMRKRRGGAMSRGRFVWLLLGGLSIIVYCSFEACLVCLYGPPPFTGVAVFLAWFAWGVAEIASALRAASRPRVEP